MRVRTKGFAVCLRNDGYAASLEVRKLYPVIDDAEAREHKLIRIIDESGDDYLYPARLFRELVLPADVRRALRLASQWTCRGFFGVADLVEVQFRLRPTLRDPDDDRILELAARAGAAIVTFNTRDFVGAAAYSVPVVRPVEFLRQIGELR